MSASTWLASLLGRPGRAPGRRGPRRPPCRPRFDNLEGRLTPSFGDLLHTFHNVVPANSAFGTTVSLSGNSVLVSYPNTDAASLFDAATGLALGYVPSGPRIVPPGTQWGLSPAAVSGNRVVIGEPLLIPGIGLPQSGSASLYDLAGNALFTLHEPMPANNDLFGMAVAVSGNSVVVGAPGKNFGGANYGESFLFNVSAGTLAHTLYPANPQVNTLFGASVAVSGNYVLVGAPGDSTAHQMAGAAYLFDATTGNLLHTFTKPHAATLDAFGYSVAVSGNTVVVGVPGDNTGAAHAGSVYLFDAVSGAQLETLNNPTPVSGDSFGWSVAVSGNNLLVGSPFHGNGALNPASGAAYLFNTQSGALLSTFADPAGTAGDHFGASVAASGAYALIGAPGDNTGAPHAGSAYLFDAAPNPPPPGPSGPAPAAPVRHAITARLYRVKKGHRRLWEVSVLDADTGQLLTEFRCPYQEPAYRGVQLRTVDANHDGLADTVVLTARRGRRAVSRSYLMV